MPELARAINPARPLDIRMLGYEQAKRVINVAEVLVEVSTDAQNLRHEFDPWLELTCGKAHRSFSGPRSLQNPTLRLVGAKTIDQQLPETLWSEHRTQNAYFFRVGRCVRQCEGECDRADCKGSCAR
jgi:hypothetical protein